MSDVDSDDVINRSEEQGEHCLKLKVTEKIYFSFLDSGQLSTEVQKNQWPLKKSFPFTFTAFFKKKSCGMNYTKNNFHVVKNKPSVFIMRTYILFLISRKFRTIPVTT